VAKPEVFNGKPEIPNGANPEISRD
jgi:hypothetical protein